MTLSVVTPAQRYAQLVTTLRADPGVNVAVVRKRGLGTAAMCVDGKLFAALSWSEQLVVRLPRDRVDALVAGNRGARFEPCHGQPMQEWLIANVGTEVDWLSLANEALSFVRKVEERRSDDVVA
jgi:hypothetical protein